MTNLLELYHNMHQDGAMFTESNIAEVCSRHSISLTDAAVVSILDCNRKHIEMTRNSSAATLSAFAAEITALKDTKIWPCI